MTRQNARKKVELGERQGAGEFRSNKCLVTRDAIYERVLTIDAIVLRVYNSAQSAETSKIVCCLELKTAS